MDICNLCERTVSSVNDAGICDECQLSREKMYTEEADDLCRKHDAMMADAEGAMDV